MAAFLDLSKAFDRVWIQRLIVKLFETFGMGGKTLPWIYDFLRNRLIKVRFNNSLSRSFKLHQGVPQGSVLSPTLFTLFLSGIEKVVSKWCEVGLFADDVVMWDSGIDLQKLEDNLNSTLEDLWKLVEIHKLSFNPAKSTVGFFTTNRKLYGYQPVIVNHQPLTGRKQLKLLKYISGRDWGADAGTLRNTYISLIIPILEYGISVYCCASNTNLQKLERVQLSAARVITGLRNTCPNDIVLYEANLQPLSPRRSASLVKYYGKLCSLGRQK
ncbi:putative RNA-directed DNA polymerase from transposon BS [Caerostris extrusa]|uniref:RNA-directed DNA polymerase from transposon BS n=1 Tax=Caerostris extrusa TaxID=172846 RepID=A0AAV4Y066_CAEEX|nr:putative RNA-directed DNA polymerase from transposon BS [Caerostris extrusa]